MVAYTPRLNLVKPAGSEAFKRLDFEANWNILDNNPGVQVIPNQGARPAANPANVGQMLFEQTERRLVVNTGSAWGSLRQYGFVSTKSWGTNANVTTANKPSGTPARFPPTTTGAWTITMTRPGGLAMFGTIRLAQQAGLAQDIMYKVVHNGVDDCSIYTAADQNTVRFPDAGTGATGMLSIPFSIIGYIGGLLIGDHTFRIECTLDPLGNHLSSDSITFSGAKMVFMYTDS
jgi:hypothetical protein